jgi:flagellar protein FliO/FliZ
METFLAGARVVVSLAVVLGLLWMLQRRLTRGSRKNAAVHPVTIVTKQAISPKASVVIIDVDGSRLLLGVTEHAVSVLQTGDAPAPVIEAAPAATARTTTASSGAKAFAESLGRVTAAKISAAKPATKTTVKTATAKTSAAKPSTTKTPAKPAAPKTTTAKKSPELAPVAAFTGEGPLAGSILSPTTWKQLGATIRRGR